MANGTEKRQYKVMTPIERKGKPPAWHKVGMAWDGEKDGRIDIVLNSLPLTPRLYLYPDYGDEPLPHEKYTRSRGMVGRAARGGLPTSDEEPPLPDTPPNFPDDDIPF